MKALRLLFFFVIALLVATAGLSFIMPTNQKLSRSVTIAAPADSIFEQLRLLDHFSRISVWGAQDSSIRYTLNGTDGTPGASLSWKGDPELSGEGKVEITGLIRPHTVNHNLTFTKPTSGKANSVFTIAQQDKNSTIVTWFFTLETPRPWNIFNLFYSLDKKMGADFETGLNLLKKMMEAKQRITP